VAKCADCHSNETRWPAYARIAPGSWLIERDIVEARKHMDFSHWEQLPKDRQDVLMAKIVQEARSGDMPPLQYLALHPAARVSKSDLEALAVLSKSAGEPEITLLISWCRITR
jgi:cytochrome c